jgi:hypothetical protein
LRDPGEFVPVEPAEIETTAGKLAAAKRVGPDHGAPSAILPTSRSSTSRTRKP